MLIGLALEVCLVDPEPGFRRHSRRKDMSAVNVRAVSDHLSSGEAVNVPCVDTSG